MKLTVAIQKQKTSKRKVVDMKVWNRKILIRKFFLQSNFLLLRLLLGKGICFPVQSNSFSTGLLGNVLKNFARKRTKLNHLMDKHTFILGSSKIVELCHRSTNESENSFAFSFLIGLR